MSPSLSNRHAGPVRRALPGGNPHKPRVGPVAVKSCSSAPADPKRPARRPTYCVTILGATPQDIATRVSRLHAEAVQARCPRQTATGRS